MGLFDIGGLDPNAWSQISEWAQRPQFPATPGVAPQGLDISPEQVAAQQAAMAPKPPSTIPGMLSRMDKPVQPTPEVPVQGLDISPQDIARNNVSPVSTPPRLMPFGSALADPADLIGKNFAARGISPPPADITPSVGAALNGNVTPLVQKLPTDVSSSGRGGAAAPGAPMDITTPAQQEAVAAGATGDKKPGSLADALRGVKAPAPPDYQKLGTPAAPRATTAIKSGDMMALLAALNSGAGSAGGISLPNTLGQALRGK